MKYELLSNVYRYKLAEAVNKKLKQDWHLLGGVSIDYDNDGKSMVYTQAMIKLND